MNPVNNLGSPRYRQVVWGATDDQKNAGYRHWSSEGMATVEALLARHGSSPYCFGAAPTLADCCLVPQIANAQRMGCDLAAYPRAMAVYAHCSRQAAFQAAAPQRQPDYAG